MKRAERLHGIYVILNEAPGVLELARAALDAGVRIVQYRAKSGIAPKTLAALRSLTRERDALLIANDDWRAAGEFACDGVHLGPDDAGFAHVATVRSALPEQLIGLSCGTEAEVRFANDAGADYLGIGSVYATGSKADAGEPIGTRRLRALTRASAIPVAAIGGIGPDTIVEVRECGVAMAAVISAVANAADPRRAAKSLVDEWNR
ncbi:MAG TPA: thiamine phosphate synthase [Candidatus Nitrosotalea sp.]|nr:thiamine phosphate synthase [Candidatus Nitrosotalea sp.]